MASAATSPSPPTKQKLHDIESLDSRCRQSFLWLLGASAAPPANAADRVPPTDTAAACVGEVSLQQLNFSAAPPGSAAGGALPPDTVAAGVDEIFHRQAVQTTRPPLHFRRKRNRRDPQPPAKLPLHLIAPATCPPPPHRRSRSSRRKRSRWARQPSAKLPFHLIAPATRPSPPDQERPLR